MSWADSKNNINKLNFFMRLKFIISNPYLVRVFVEPPDEPPEERLLPLLRFVVLDELPDERLLDGAYELPLLVVVDLVLYAGL
ncbi:hypothetical protein LJB85_04195 [Porphyromonadaceae bacterium OttesenSCG-928-L07]|nr:hypothetical protein [Porphyromonadaceae bacterium OttesenSCG-928-L07]